MTMHALQILRCPLCHTAFTQDGNTLRCEKGHCFDLAKEGYVNLLPPGKGKNAHTGDEKDMLRARREFLSQGYYAPISDGIADLLDPFLPDGDTVLCDSGCGEGWHTLRFTNALFAKGDRRILTLGFDASKYGAACGMKNARRDGISTALSGDAAMSVCFCPGNLFSLPVADGSVSAVISMFAPVAVTENLRLLRDDGYLVVAASGKEHLWEMRELLYTDVQYVEKEPVYDGFTLVETRPVRYTIDLPDRATIENLFMMTPFYYKTTAAGKARLLEKDALSVTVDVVLRIYRKENVV